MKKHIEDGFIKIHFYVDDYDSWAEMMADLNATLDSYTSLAKSLNIDLRIHSNDITEHQTNITTKLPDLVGRNLFFNFPSEHQDLFLDENLHQLLK